MDKQVQTRKWMDGWSGFRIHTEKVEGYIYQFQNEEKVQTVDF